MGTDTKGLAPKPNPWPHGSLGRGTMGLGLQGDKKEKNGYPFTTFTDLSDFLGIILRVLSDDLATISGHNTDFTDLY